MNTTHVIQFRKYNKKFINLQGVFLFFNYRGVKPLIINNIELYLSICVLLSIIACGSHPVVELRLSPAIQI